MAHQRPTPGTQVRKLQPSRSPAPGRGFTLVEVLVVIGIIAVLAAMVLAALASSKATARRVQCLSNLRQMNIAASVYVDENRDTYPVAYYEDTVNNIDYAWDFTTIKGNPNRVVAGLLWQAQGNIQIQQCPSFRGSANWLADPYTGYNYNTSYIGHGQYESIPQPAQRSAVQHPSKTALFGDGQYSAGADKFMRAPFSNPGDASFWGRAGGTQGFRHRNTSNVAFCDSHVDSVKTWYTNNVENAAVAPGTGFLSPDNSAYDLQ